MATRVSSASPRPDSAVCDTCGGAFPTTRSLCPVDGRYLVRLGAPHPEVGRVVAERYRVTSLIGEGGMGRVFAAERLTDGQEVALKLPLGGQAEGVVLERFRREALVSSAVRHPGIVTVLDHQVEGTTTPYLVMERLRGPTLADLVATGELPEVPVLLEQIAEVAETLDAAHRLGILHRDVKPSNIMLHQAPEHDDACVKLVDFGLVRLSDAVAITKTSQSVGTLRYMSPEQFQGAPLTPATDLFSLGVVLYELLAGRPPFMAENVADLALQRMSRPAPALSRFRPDLAGPLDPLLARCLAIRAERRIASGHALSEALRRVARGGAAVTSERAGAADPARWLGTVLEGRIRLEEHLGRDRFGSLLFRGHRASAAADVLVRVHAGGTPATRDAVLEAFQRESVIGMTVRHPNLLPVVDVGADDGCVYAVLPFEDTEPLQTWAIRNAPADPRAVRRALLPVIDVVAALHAAGLVSGGVTESTIRVRRAGDDGAVFAPLGLARVDQVGAIAAAWWSADAFGDAAIAPEQAAGSPPSAAADVYGLGRVLAGLLSWRSPVAPTVPVQRARAALVAEAPTLDETWSALLERALADDPRDRFADASELGAALVELPPALAERRGTVAPATTAGLAGSFSVQGFAGRPAIAVLAFENLGADHEQEYFADGLAEDLTARLARGRIFPVIAHHSSFTYKGRPVDVAQISRELGVRYLVRGRVRRTRHEVRVSVELIEAPSARQVWSARHDRPLREVFALQDEIADAIVAALEPALLTVEQQRVKDADADTLDAWDRVQRGWWHLWRHTAADTGAALGWARSALELHPTFAPASALLAGAHLFELLYGWGGSSTSALGQATDAARRAVAADPELAEAHFMLAMARTFVRDFEGAILAAERAIELNASFARAYWALGVAEGGLARADAGAGAPMIEKALRLSPQDPVKPFMLQNLGIARLLTGDHAAAADCARRSLQDHPLQPHAWRLLAAAYGHLGRLDEARQALATAFRLAPTSLDDLRSFNRPEIVDQILAGWRHTGWHE